MIFWAVVGDGNTQKSAIIRGLTGVGRRERNWRLSVSGTVVQIFVEQSAPQEQNSPMTPSDIEAEIEASARRFGVTHALVALRHDATAKLPGFPAEAYIDHFMALTWTCRGIAITGDGRTGSHLIGRYPGLVTLLAPPSKPFGASNRRSAQLRNTWGID